MEAFGAVLFDMDGVVIDTRQSILDFWQAVAAEQGVRLTADDIDRHIHGVPLAHTLKALFPTLPPEPDRAFLERITRYELGLRYTEVVGVTSLLQSLKAAAIPTALVTSGMGWKVDAVFSQLALGGLFDVVVTAADIERGKPDPACYLAAASKLDVAPANCVVFEDSVSGVRSAIAAGMVCIGVQSGHLADLLIAAGVRHTIPDFTVVQLDQSGDGTQLRLSGGFTSAFQASASY